MNTITKAIAVSAACLAVAPAFATPSNTVPTSNQLFISGATATNPALYGITVLSTNGLCDPAQSVDVYIDTAGPTFEDANDQYMIACEGRPGSAFAGQSVLLAKESVGGSNNGTRNVARSQALDFLNPTSPSCDAPVAVAADGTKVAHNLHKNCSGLVTKIPDAGVADVEAALFNTPTAADIAALTAKPLFQIIFAPAVSTNLYRALQTAQGLTPNDDEANVPNITRGQLVRIFSGEAFTWDEFVDKDGNSFLAGEDVYVCRRGEDSGTQASFASYYLNERCNASVPKFIGPDDASCLLGGCGWSASYENDFIFAGDGSGDVRACLNYHSGASEYAIGVLSTNTSQGTSGRDFRFVGTDGAAPTRVATANGGYHFVVENVLNVRGSGPGGVPGDIVNYIVANIGQPSVISGINDQVTEQAGGKGILGVPNGTTILENAPPVTSTDMDSNPVSSFTRSVSGSSNNCQPQSATLGSQVIGGLQ